MAHHCYIAALIFNSLYHFSFLAMSLAILILYPYNFNIHSFTAILPLTLVSASFTVLPSLIYGLEVFINLPLKRCLFLFHSLYTIYSAFISIYFITLTNYNCVNQECNIFHIHHHVFSIGVFLFVVAYANMIHVYIKFFSEKDFSSLDYQETLDHDTYLSMQTINNDSIEPIYIHSVRYNTMNNI